MSCMAVDPAAGGKDKSTIAMRYDGWFAKIVEKPGVETPMPDERMPVFEVNPHCR